jgi:isoleucyl-tRNA synthetase
MERIKTAYEEYAFHKVYRAVYDFSTVDLSAFYFDIVKDRLYTAPAKSVRRRSAQTTLYRLADALVRVAAPLMCFTADEVWSCLAPPAKRVKESSVHLAKSVSPDELRAGIPSKLLKRLQSWPQLIAVRGEVLKALEIARQRKSIASGLEAKVHLSTDGNLAPLLEDYRAALPALFIVSQVGLSRNSLEGAYESQLPGLQIRIEKASGSKCARCWNYSERVGKDSNYPTVCERCSAALKEIETISP